MDSGAAVVGGTTAATGALFCRGLVLDAGGVGD